MRELLRDSRKSQRGSVLSGVLIITAFLSILGGALMNELTTGFLLSRVMVNRVNAQATVNSAAEIALDQLQATARDSACPSQAPVTQLNSLTAAVNYVDCELVTDSDWLKTKAPLATWSPFTMDGAHVQLPGLRDAYLVSDVDGQVSAYDIYQSSMLWSKKLGGNLSGPPMEMLDRMNPQAGITTLVPILNPNDSGISPNCASGRCVAALIEYPPQKPMVECFMESAGHVTSAPAAARRIINLAYFGDDAGHLYAYTTTGGGKGGDGDGNWQDGGGNGGNCSRRAKADLPGGQAVKGVLALRGSRGWTDDVFVLTDSKILRYSYGPSGFSALPIASLDLPWTGGAISWAADSTSVPVSLAITFADGGVATFQIDTGYQISLLGTPINLGAPIKGAPYWSSRGLIGVGVTNGTLIVLNRALSSKWTYTGPGPILTAPAEDSQGDWFYGDDKMFYKLHPPSKDGTAMRLVTSIPLGQSTGSSPAMGRCAVGICAYLGTRSGNLYMIPFDARSVTLTVCLINASPTCSGANPMLWVSAEVGNLTSQRAVRVRGWSYYSG
jgi:Tfp pilus assembly protein PilX